MQRRVLILNWAMIPSAVGLMAILVLALTGWPPGQRRAGGGHGDEDVAPLHPASQQARQFLEWAPSVSWRPLTNTANPFFTLAIQPVPPPQPSAPPPPATRKVDFVYRGFFETSARVRRALVKVQDKEMIVGKGDKVFEDFGVTEIELGHLGITNGTGSAVRLEFSKPASIEVPSK
ncbi:MAG: hypothetical protein AB7J34_07910 [Limisphaerales bacterium]